MDETPLDAAQAAAAAAPEDDALRLAAHGRLLEAELFLLLAAESAGERLEPRIFPLESGPVVLAFDRDDRLAAFLSETAAGPAPFATLTGRRLAALLAGRGVGLGVNLGVAASEMLLSAAAVDWLAALAASRPQRTAGAPRRFTAMAPDPRLEAALAGRLAGLEGLFAEAHLVAADHPEGPRPMLAVVGAAPEAEAVMAAAIAETLRFLDGAPPLDVTFVAADARALPAIAAVGHRFAPAPPKTAPRGVDRSRPPVLR